MTSDEVCATVKLTPNMPLSYVYPNINGKRMTILLNKNRLSQDKNPPQVKTLCLKTVLHPLTTFWLLISIFEKTSVNA